MRTHKGNNQTPRLHLCACHSFLMSRLWALSWGCLEGMCPEAHRRHQGPCPLTSCRELSNLGSPPRGGREGEWDPTKCALAMRIAASERGTCGGGAPRTPSSSPRGPASAPGESEEGPRSCLIGEQLPSREAIPFRLQTASPAACTSPAPLGGLRKL